MEDWKLTPNNYCIQKYSENNELVIVQLAAHCLQIVESFQIILPLFTSFSKKLEKFKSTVISSVSDISLFRELSVITQTNECFVNILNIFKNAILNMSNTLNDDNSWKEEMSNVNNIQMQQKQMVSNITLYKSFAQYISDVSVVTQETTKINNAIQSVDPEQLKTVSTALIDERKNALKTQFNKSLSEINNENKNKNEIPFPIMRVLYGLYFSPRTLEGVFRVNGDKNEITEYTKYMGVVDIKTVDNINLSAIIKNFSRELTTPIWPNHLLQPLLECTTSFEKKEFIWVSKMRDIIKQLPKINEVVLKHLLALFGRISLTDESKMDYKNISVCIALSIIVPKDDVKTITKNTQVVIRAFELMLKHRNALYTDLSDLFKQRMVDIVIPPIYHDVFFNKKQSSHFKKKESTRIQTRRALFK